jgi:hypothetical protein
VTPTTWTTPATKTNLPEAPSEWRFQFHQNSEPRSLNFKVTATTAAVNNNQFAVQTTQQDCIHSFD